MMTQNKKKKQKQILQAAKEMFGRYGFRKTTVDEIAEQAGISKRTMYKLFHSKVTLLADLVLDEALTFRSHCLVTLQQYEDPSEKVQMFFKLSNAYFDENPFLGRVMADDDRLYTPFLGDELHWVEEGIESIMAGLLRHGIESGVFRDEDFTATLQCMMVLFCEFAYHRGSRQDGNDAWISFILHAISRDPTGES
ncbi:MAG: TetR/AcrR family transcriptional regulator [Chloroflexi bacterium]|nr:TetR/AcrR family transcriptional regulator [Chloroflexota bacterium]